MKSTLSAVLATLLSVTLVPARADYPERPVKVIVPFQVGGAGDVAARALADGLSKKTGQNFVVGNRPAATGLVGTQAAATTPPDGYTLCLGHSDTVGLNTLLRKKLPYDAFK